MEWPDSSWEFASGWAMRLKSYEHDRFALLLHPRHPNSSTNGLQFATCPKTFNHRGIAKHKLPHDRYSASQAEFPAFTAVGRLGLSHFIVRNVSAYHGWTSALTSLTGCVNRRTDAAPEDGDEMNRFD
jgi:hypothetical protein